MNRKIFLGIKLNEDELNALELIAEREGQYKSSFARQIIRKELIKMGAITITNPAPQQGAMS